MTIKTIFIPPRTKKPRAKKKPHMQATQNKVYPVYYGANPNETISSLSHHVDSDDSQAVLRQVQRMNFTDLNRSGTYNLQSLQFAGSRQSAGLCLTLSFLYHLVKNQADAQECFGEKAGLGILTELPAGQGYLICSGSFVSRKPKLTFRIVPEPQLDLYQQVYLTE